MSTVAASIAFQRPSLGAPREAWREQDAEEGAAAAVDTLKVQEDQVLHLSNGRRCPTAHIREQHIRVICHVHLPCSLERQEWRH